MKRARSGANILQEKIHEVSIKTDRDDDIYP